MAEQRESSFELIRIIAQFFIVLYHLFCFFIYPVSENLFFKAIWLPLHIGVLLFVMISGYFGIKANIKGLIKLLGMMAVLYLPLSILYICIYGYSLDLLQETVLWISSSPFWFMRTYLFLYLFSPVLNQYIYHCSNKQLFALILILFFISHYCGSIGYDSSLLMGKNLPTFMFLYVVGYAIKKYQHKWQKINIYYFALSYIILNLLLIIIFSIWKGYFANLIFEKVFFSYCSIGLLFSAILFFLWIGGLKFYSPTINRIAKSSLTIYMLHGANLIFIGLIKPVVNWILYISDNNIQIFIFTFIFAVVIVLSCIFIDTILQPIWKLIQIGGSKLQTKWDSIIFN